MSPQHGNTTRFLRIAVVAGLLVVSVPVSAVPPDYTMTWLSTLDGNWSAACAINELGEIVGSASLGAAERAFLWTPQGGMIDLGALDDGVSAAADINDLQEVVGVSNNRAVIWLPQPAYGLPAGINDLGFGSQSEARAINNVGQVIVFVNNGASYLWEAGAVTNLDHPWHGEMDFYWTQAQGINDQGQVVGVWITRPAPTFEWIFGTFLWDETAGFVDTTPPCVALCNYKLVKDINELGQSAIISGPEWYFWDSGTNSLMPALCGYPEAINDAGEVVGNDFSNAYCLWSGNVMYSFDDLLGPCPYWEPDEGGLDINNAGQIVGGAWVEEQTWHRRAFVMNPGIGKDCNSNGIADHREVAAATGADCQPNCVLDVCDIAGGTSIDVNGNSVPDECEGCLFDTDCTDGLFCNGAEICSNGLCLSGTVINCDDGIGCTIDFCDEVADGCVNAPSNGLCDDGAFCNGTETCDVLLDCLAGVPPCSPDEVCNEVTHSCHADCSIRSTFDSDLDGWTRYDPNQIDIWWVGSGGFPGGYLRSEDLNPGSAIARAPAKFHGNWSALDRAGALRLDTRFIEDPDNHPLGGYPTITLLGPGGTAGWDSPKKATSAWQRHRVALREELWNVTQGDWLNLLAQIDTVLVGLDYTTGHDQNGLDNFTLYHLGDANEDCAVDLVDHGYLVECLTGPGVPPAPAPPLTALDCLTYFDFDVDDDVDLADYGFFIRLFGVSSNGACCLPSGLCIERVDAPTCAAHGGAYQGDGTLCYAGACPAPQACCYPDGACADQLALDCLNSSGLPQGEETDCASTICPTVEACCLPSGMCLDATWADCVASNGISQGPGTDCAGIEPCPQPVACCFADGSCADLFGPDCTSNGGIVQGEGTNCAATVCEALEACCLPDGSCADVPLDDCLNSNGTAQGPGTVCEFTSCPPPVDPELLQVRSLADHGPAGELGIVVLPVDRNVESRDEGIHLLEITFSTVMDESSCEDMANMVITDSGGAIESVAATAILLPGGTTLRIELATALDDMDCYTFDLSGMESAAGLAILSPTFEITALIGDVTADGIVGSSDLLTVSQPQYWNTVPSEVADSVRVDCGTDGRIKEDDQDLIIANNGNRALQCP